MPRALLILGPALAVAFGVGMIAVLNAAKAGTDVEKDMRQVAPGARPRTLGPADAELAVLCVHGFVGGANNFGALPEALAAKGWRVHCMRLPGHGTRARDLKRVTADELRDAVEAETTRLLKQHENVVLAGHSMGGALSTLVAAGKSAAGLVLAAPYFGVTHKWYYLMRPEQWVKVSGPIVPWLYKGELFLQVNRKEAKDEIYSYTWVPMKAVKTLMELGRRAGEDAVLKKVACPVLLVHGVDDEAASHEAAAEAFEGMAAEDKRAVWLKNSNHHLFFDYDREQAIAEIVKFVEGLT